ncbi:ribbon-helix-helix protein, CopG family [Paraburkholderia sp. 1N]|uniref:Ribbon-helix-helix protein, CopG family n=1 Tax=Paraburkholderia solitsugae TaxID=2675748 RepID=A0ABX2BUC4_9BURK|nr:ribbon-helix-helix protein, CopG family [Paraburkholderia solitsugae]NPT44329.1 ribbon-helix-helix protein, CopG family [Paraburkholderia solitsugae]
MKRLHLVMPLQIFEPLNAIAARDGRTISELIRQALLEFIARQNKV